MTNSNSQSDSLSAHAGANTMICPSNPGHGPMSLRTTGQTKEQQWCGIWYDCQDGRCHSSILFESPELQAHNEAAFGRIAGRFNALRGKRQRERFLKGCSPWIAEALRDGRTSLYRNDADENAKQ